MRIGAGWMTDGLSGAAPISIGTLVLIDWRTDFAGAFFSVA
jgi:hypothetical protein